MALQLKKKEPLLGQFGLDLINRARQLATPAGIAQARQQRDSVLGQVNSALRRPPAQVATTFGQASSNYRNPLSLVGDAAGSLFEGTRNTLRATDALTGAYGIKQRAADEFLRANMGKPGANDVAQRMRQSLLDEYSFAGNRDAQGRVNYNLTPAENVAKAAGVTLQAASEVAPFRIGQAFIKGGGTAANIARAGLAGGTASGVGSAGAQLTQTGRVDPIATAKDAAVGAGIAGAIPGVSATIRRVFGRSTPPTPVARPLDTPEAINARLASGGKINAFQRLNPGYQDAIRQRPLATKPMENQITANSKKVSAPVPDTKPTVALKTNIDKSDPFGNKNILTRIRREAGRLGLDDDAEMISLLRKVEKQTGRKGLVDQWMFDTGNVRSSNAMANAKIKNSPELSGALRGLSKRDLDEFDTYVGARAELKNYAGKKTSRTAGESRQIVNALEGKYGQRFESLNAYYKNLAREMHGNGLISGEKLKQYLNTDDYVRIQRDMDDLVDPQFTGSRSRSIGTTTATQKRTGSEREIISPTKTVVRRTQQIGLESARNKAATNTINTLRELGLARPVKDTKNKNTISRLVDGKREIYEVPKDIKRVVDNVNPYQLGVIAQIVSAPARLFRAGTTALSAPFTVTNYFRDQLSSGLYSKKVLATHNPANVISGLASAARDFAGESRSPLWKKFEQYVGDITVADELRNAKNADRLLREVRKGQAGKLGNMAISPVRTLEDLNSITEKATRFQNFKGIYQKTLKETGNEEEAIRAAVLAARQNSVDFMRNSSVTRVANLFIPYFNASVQGSRNVARSFRDRPVATTIKSIGFIAVPSVAAVAYNYADPERRKIYESINEFEKEDNFIIIGPDARQREDGSWEGIIKIPKPQGYRELTDPVRDVTEAFLKNEPVEEVGKMFKDMLGGLTGPVNIEDGGKVVGSFIPQLAKPWIQLAMNKDLYTGKDVVPEFMIEETDDPTKRAYGGTSGSARLVAEQLGVSPIQVEKAMKDIAGSLGLYGTNLIDTGLASAGVIPEEQIGGRSMASDFSRRLFEASAEKLDENKSSGERYYEDVKTVTEGLDKNELAAFNSLHPKKTNFLGEDIFDENKRITNYTRAGAYLNNPGVLEADRKLDQLQRADGKPGNPLFDLPKPQLTKALLKAALPPGASDPELSNLFKEPWYQDYQNARSKYYDQIKQSLEKEGKTLPKAANPYPETPPQLQKAMDAYSALSKGTGERSNWIKANPGLWQQMTTQWSQVDAWENKERVAIGLAPVVKDASQGKFGGRGQSSAGSPYKYAVSLRAGGEVAKPKVNVRASGKKVGAKGKGAGKPKVTIKRSSV